MRDLPDELRDRAARAGHGVLFCGEPADSEADISWQQWLAIVDAVAEVLAEHQGEADKAFNDLCHEFNDAQDELVLLRAIVAELRPDAVAEMESPEVEAHSHGFTAGRDSAEAEITDLRVRVDELKLEINAELEQQRDGSEAYNHTVSAVIRERDDLRARLERAEAELAKAQKVVRRWSEMGFRAASLVEECPRCHLCLTCTIDDCAGCARSVSSDPAAPTEGEGHTCTVCGYRSQDAKFGEYRYWRGSVCQRCWPKLWKPPGPAGAAHTEETS